MADAVESLNNFAKEVFADKKPENLVPEQNVLQKELPFSFKEAYGLKYVEAIRLSYPAGFTHQAADGTGGAFALNDATASTRARIEVQGEQILLKDQFSYEDGARVAKGGKRAFVSFAEETVDPMVRSMRKRLETQLLYGKGALGRVDTYTSGDPSVTIQAAEWAEGIWVGMEGAALLFYSALTGGTTRNSGTAVTIDDIDFANKKLTLSGTVSGCTNGDYIFWNGARGEEMAGVDHILTNTGSLFNVDAGTYRLWKGTSYAAGSAPLSFGKVKKAIASSYNLGLDSDVVVMMSPEAFDDMSTDINELRTVDKSEVAKVDLGHKEICYYFANIKAIMRPSNFIKKGKAYGLCKKDWKRIGAIDVTFNTPGMEGEKMFHHLETKAGIEMRAYTNQAIFCRRPAASFVITGITNRS